MVGELSAQGRARYADLLDGNRRLGWLGIVVFYGVNDIALEAPDDAAYGLVIAVATGSPSVQETAESLARWH